MKIEYRPKSIWTAKFLIIFDDNGEIWNIFDDYTEFNHLVRRDEVRIKSEIRMWAEENDIELMYINNTGELYFYTEADAIAFKLKWG